MSSVKVSQTLGLERLMDNMDHIYIRIYMNTYLHIWLWNMERLMDKPWHICASNAVTGEGLNEAREIDVKSDYYDY